MTTRSRQTFKELITLPDLAIPLADAALLLACEEYPQLSLSPYLDELDRMAEKVSQRLGGNGSPLDTIHAINGVLFTDYGFRGNDSNYYDPRNSFLNEVIDRRTGIPITLSAIYIEVAQRIDLRVEGVGLPGHFIVKHRSRNDEIFIDPFNQGSILTRDQCRGLLRHVQLDPDEEFWLRRVTNRQILVRMLTNLKVIYMKAKTFDKALLILELMVLTQPGAAELYKERGLLRLQERQFKGALEDLEHYLKNRPDAPDRSEIEDYLKNLGRIRAMRN